MRFRPRAFREEPEINFIPLIDVLLVILIFLMVTTTYSRFAELQINLPTADADRQLERSNEVTVVVDTSGQYLINKTSVTFGSIEQLAGELRKAGAGLREPIVIVTADRASNWQAVVRVMEAARLAGMPQITFTTQATK